MARELILRLTKDDFRFDYFRAGGKGGQKQNKTNSGVRCVHPPSGAAGEGRDARSQPENKRSAFKRCVQSEKFQLWLRKQTNSKIFEQDEIDQKVNDLMRESNIITQVKNEKGQWIEPDSELL